MIHRLRTMNVNIQETFHPELKNINLLVEISEDTNMIRINPLGTINVMFKCHGNPSSGCRDISVWTKVLD